jgi:hypothetical protein
LRGFRAAAVAEHNCGAKNRARNVRQQLLSHVLAELLGAGVGVVVGAPPVDGSVFLDDFVLACSCDGNRGNMGKTPQAMVVLRTPGQLNDFEGAAQVYVEALLFRFSVERSGAMDQ